MSDNIVLQRIMVLQCGIVCNDEDAVGCGIIPLSPDFKEVIDIGTKEQ